MVLPEGKLTPTQYEIMELFWEAAHAGLTVTQVWEAIGQRRSLTRTTIQNLVDRLESRHWLTRRKEKGGYRYVAEAEQAETARSLAEDFVDDFFGGSARDLVMSLFGSKRLKREELVQLRELLDAKLNKRKPRES